MNHRTDQAGDHPDDDGLRGIYFDKKPFDLSKTHEDWHKIRQHLHSGRRMRASRYSMRRLRPGRAAAALILFLMAAAAFMMLKDRLSRISYATGFGEIRQIRLPDGSSVTLNADSRLYFHRDWDKREAREVWINGEAFFKVSTQLISGKKVKFIVHTGDLNVEVVGTEFNVRKRRGQTRVTLASGKVRIDLPENEDIILRPGEQFVFSPGRKRAGKRAVETRKYISWKDGELILDHKTLGKVAEILQETYGREVVFRDERLKTLTLSGSYPLGDMDRLLHALEMAAQISVEYDEKQIIFSE